jgi:pimeloyl-ACP methyl ester carboxylesterase
MDTEMTSYANLLGLANTKEKQMARFVLVHGGFSGAWIWLPLIDALRAAGHSVEAFDLPTANIDVSTTLDRTTIDTYS